MGYRNRAGPPYQTKEHCGEGRRGDHCNMSGLTSPLAEPRRLIPPAHAPRQFGGLDDRRVRSPLSSVLSSFAQASAVVAGILGDVLYCLCLLSVVLGGAVAAVLAIDDWRMAAPFPCPPLPWPWLAVPPSCPVGREAVQ